MRRLNRPIPLLIIAVALAGVTCSFPTDKSDKVFVTLEAPSRVVLRGQEMSVLARAYRVVGTDTQAIGNVDFAFYTTSGTVARVEPTGGGYATVIGVNSGTADILARAIAFEKAPQADLALRVSNPLEVDSVRPAIAHHGERVTVYGVGVDSMFLASIANVNLIEYPFSRVRDPATGLGRISFWVPPPAHSAPLFYLGAGVFGFAKDTTAIVYEDVFEPNDTAASLINLDLGGPWPGTILSSILFINPALAFEPQARGAEGRDWFKFLRTDTTRATTFIINYKSVGIDTLTRTFLIDSLSYSGNFIFPPSVTFIGSKWSYCKNSIFAPTQVTRESTVVALKELPSRHISVLTFFSNPQRYGLTVVDGYLTADPRIRPDRFEENDLCTFADRPGQRITIPSNGLFTDSTLTIDNAFDIDWYRVDIAPGASDSLRIHIRPRPFGLRDSSDVDVYVLTTTPPITKIASATSAGSVENLTVGLAAGSYYVVVTDFAGVATRYSMCMRLSASALIDCTPLTSALVAAPSASVIRRRERFQPLGQAPAVVPLAPGASPFAPRRP